MRWKLEKNGRSTTSEVGVTVKYIITLRTDKFVKSAGERSHKINNKKATASAKTNKDSVDYRPGLLDSNV